MSATHRAITSMALLLSWMLAACTAGDSVRATTPTTTVTTTTTTTTTTTVTTTTAGATTTTGTDRVAEIEAIFRDLEQRRLDALYRKDEEAFRALFANEAYLEESLVALDLAEFETAPSVIRVEVVSVLADTDGCIAAQIETDFSSALGTDAVSRGTVVLERNSTTWGYSYAYGTEAGWTCDGPHPLD